MIPLSNTTFLTSAQSGSPRFLGSLHFRSATLLDPGRASLPGPLRQFRTAPDKTTTKAPSTLAFSRLSHAASRLALYASSPSLPPAGKTRFRLVASLYRVGFLHPQGSSRKFPVQHVNSCHPFLLLQAYPGATPLRLCVKIPLLKGPLNNNFTEWAPRFRSDSVATD